MGTGSCLPGLRTLLMLGGKKMKLRLSDQHRAVHAEESDRELEEEEMEVYGVHFVSLTDRSSVVGGTGRIRKVEEDVGGAEGDKENHQPKAKRCWKGTPIKRGTRILKKKKAEEGGKQYTPASAKGNGYYIPFDKSDFDQNAEAAAGNFSSASLYPNLSAINANANGNNANNLSMVGGEVGTGTGGYMNSTANDEDGAKPGPEHHQQHNHHNKLQNNAAFLSSNISNFNARIEFAPEGRCIIIKL